MNNIKDMGKEEKHKDTAKNHKSGACATRN